MKTTGFLKVKVVLIAREQFVHDGFLVQEVWFTAISDRPRSNTVWFRGVDFYTGRAGRGRIVVSQLPDVVAEALRSETERLIRAAP